MTFVLCSNSKRDFHQICALFLCATPFVKNLKFVKLFILTSKFENDQCIKTRPWKLKNLNFHERILNTYKFSYFLFLFNQSDFKQINTDSALSALKYELGEFINQRLKRLNAQKESVNLKIPLNYFSEPKISTWYLYRSHFLKKSVYTIASHEKNWMIS